MKNLRLLNFKCFVDKEISFRQCTVLTGGNAVGKSSIIQALLLCDYLINNAEYQLALKDVIHIAVGGMRRLVSQRSQKIADMDLGFEIDGESVKITIDKENPARYYISKAVAAKMNPVIYLSAERIGPRSYYQAEGTPRLDAHGNNAAYLMELADMEGLQIPYSLIVDDKTMKFSYQVECWLDLIMNTPIQISNKVDYESARAELSYKNDLVDAPIVPPLTGFGISYCLPIIVAGLWCASKGQQILIVENPEAHLHPFSQSMVGKFLAMVADAGVQVIVETHSEHVLDGARIQSYKLGKIDNFIANFLTLRDNAIDVKQIFIEKNGELSDWPHGFFDQKQNDLRDLFLMRTKDGDKK